MAAVLAPPEHVEALVAAIPARLAIAAYNGPESVVLSGAEDALQAALAAARDAGLRLAAADRVARLSFAAAGADAGRVRALRRLRAGPAAAHPSRRQPHGARLRRRRIPRRRLLAPPLARAGAVRDGHAHACRARLARSSSKSARRPISCRWAQVPARVEGVVAALAAPRPTRLALAASMPFRAVPAAASASTGAASSSLTADGACRCPPTPSLAIATGWNRASALRACESSGERVLIRSSASVCPRRCR